MTRRHLRSTLLALVLLAGLGCSGPTRGLKDPSKMKGVVLKAVPVGSRIEEARRFMEREGFRCSPQTKSSFADHDGTRKGIDYLYCDRSEGLIVSRRWQVAIVHSGDRVTDVLANTGLIGP